MYSGKEEEPNMLTVSQLVRSPGLTSWVSIWEPPSGSSELEHKFILLIDCLLGPTIVADQLTKCKCDDAFSIEEKGDNGGAPQL